MCKNYTDILVKKRVKSESNLPNKSRIRPEPDPSTTLAVSSQSLTINWLTDPPDSRWGILPSPGSHIYVCNCWWIIDISVQLAHNLLLYQLLEQGRGPGRISQTWGIPGGHRSLSQGKYFFIKITFWILKKNPGPDLGKAALCFQISSFPPQFLVRF